MVLCTSVLWEFSWCYTGMLLKPAAACMAGCIISVHVCVHEPHWDIRSALLLAGPGHGHWDWDGDTLGC